MTKDRIYLRGLGTALVTPFKEDKSVDFDSLEWLVDFQVRNGADFLVVLGTTGETPTLSEDEMDDILRCVVRVTVGRVPIVAGVSHNGTLRTVDRLRTMYKDGIAAALVVCPYYNKPSQEGLYQHFRYVSENSPLPVVIYNVPARTAVNMLPETTFRLANDCPNIVGIKEASGIVSQIDLVVKNRPDGFFVLSGDDTITYPLMALGADGVISVVGNAFPGEFGEMVHMLEAGDYHQALMRHRLFKDLYGLLFVDGNPVGIKAVMSRLGYISETLRLPLVPMQDHNRTTLHEVLDKISQDVLCKKLRRESR